MQSPEITITLSNPKREYRLDDTLKGSVYIKINSDVQCSNVYLAKMWTAKGKGQVDRDYDRHGVVPIYMGRLYRGEYKFDFELPVDQPPLSYDGEILKINWTLTAFTIDADGNKYWKEIYYILKNNPNNSDIYSLAKNNKTEVEVNSSDKERYNLEGKGNWTIFAMLGVIAWLGLSSGLIITEIVGVIFSLIALSVAVSTINRKISTYKLSNIKVSLAKSVYSVGEQVNLNIEIKPNKKIKIKQVIVELKKQETTSFIGGGYAGPTRHYDTAIELIEKQLAYSNKLAIPDKQDYFSYRFSLTIPRDAMSSFTAEYNEIGWSISVYIDIKNSPSWSDSLDISVTD
ncbi:hypothetical protein [Reinekea thalattae]|uniref:Arrestin C-terminal-like domain-containing protein n=1 Tax=Reinekea thalattae TaxID=2593301 RepID=A0A5C8ZCI3_9GAMM|nr:hypothetical protein [Reinekea thalattae]TXR54626.1 hypothetical protein FME95_08840 [Reinekea thalattae]